MNLQSEIECDFWRRCSTSSESRTSSGCARWRYCRSDSSRRQSICWARKCEELEKLKDSTGELQLALKLLAETEKEIAAIEEAERRIARGGSGEAEEKASVDEGPSPQPGHGPTEQLELEHV